MEFIIILIVIAIIGYVIYQTLPNPQFNYAQTLFDSGNLEAAIKILNEIFEKHPDAPYKLAECKLKQGQNAKTKASNEALLLFNEVLDIEKKLPAKGSKSKYKVIAAKASLEIALIHFDNACAITNQDTKIKQLSENLKFIESTRHLGVESDFAALIKKHSHELAELNFQLGVQYEKSKKYDKAIPHYSTAKGFAEVSSSTKTFYNSIVRIGICKLKAKPKDIEFSSFADFNKADQKYTQDFFYRYILFQLKKDAFVETESILNGPLNLPNKTIEKFKEFVKTKKIRNAVKNVKEINTTIDQLYDRSFPVSEVKNLYESLEGRISEIEAVSMDISEKLSAIRPALFNRLLSHYISEKQFANAIILIHKFPSFWQSAELVKNIGICSYGFLAQGKLTEKNYRVIISNWLTSVFSDNAVLKSLETTTWDDDYTFTLTEAIGSNYQQHNNLPQNVNYDDVSESNVSIGATQRELLQQFESLLNKTVSDPLLAKAANDYYIEEKEAIERIVTIIDKDIVFAAPTFAKSYKLNEYIITELDEDYRVYGNEDSLEAGIPYLNGNSNTLVHEYSTARETVKAMVIAIQSNKLKDLKSASTGKKISLIEKYETIKESLEDTLYTAFTKRIEANPENEELIALMEECLGFVKNNNKLKSQCSTFIQEYCDSRWKSTSALKLLELMIKSIKYNPNNYRAAKSLTILINNNLMDIANDNTTSTSTTKIYSLIDDVRKVKSEVLKQALSELSVLRNKILSTMGADARRTILLGINLNSNGLKLKRVLDTMETLSGIESPKTIFDYL